MHSLVNYNDLYRLRYVWVGKKEIKVIDVSLLYFSSFNDRIGSCMDLYLSQGEIEPFYRKHLFTESEY